MHNEKLSILFLLQRVKINRRGKCPLRCRLTYREERKEFSTGQFVIPNNWYNKLQVAKPPDDENTFLNNQLSLIKSKLNQAFLFLQLKGSQFDVDDIYKVYKGEPLKKEKKVLETFKEYNYRIQNLIGKEIEEVTYTKYVESFNHLHNFINFKFKSSDIKLIDLSNNFLEDYDYYLKTEKGKDKKGLAQSTINKAIQRFRKVLKYGISQGYIKEDPFSVHKPKPVKKKIIFLAVEELKMLEAHTFHTQRIQNIKDYFIFCCYTGLAFKEMSRLKKSDIFVGYDGHLWIDVHRFKTDREYNVPLLAKAKVIIDKFNDENSDLVFPKISNQKFNEYLKEIASILDFKINLTHHVARKTFASTVLLYNDVPIEIVSKLLGHAKITTTQESYGQVVQKKVGEAIRSLEKKFS